MTMGIPGDDRRLAYRGQGESSTDQIEKDDVAAGRVAKEELRHAHWTGGHETYNEARGREKAERGTEAKIGAAKTLVDHAAEEGAVHAVVHFGAAGLAAGSVLAEVGLAGAGAGVVWEMLKGVHRDVQWGDELKTRSDVDARDAAMVNLLDLDPRFKDKEWKRFDGIAPSDTRYKNADGTLTDLGKARVPAWQAAADAGASTAMRAISAGGTKAYFEAHPDAARRWQRDIAFNKGFENAMFLEHDPGKLRELEKTIEARNPWMTSNVPVRG